MGVAYRREIDGLRAIAVLGVCSTTPARCLRSGYVGVDIFFVISGT
jgi:peptidoglycan/LPS O-acetylase OafA/YrhL